MTLHVVIPIGYGTGPWLSGKAEPLREGFTLFGGLTPSIRLTPIFLVLRSSPNRTTPVAPPNRGQSP